MSQFERCKSCGYRQQSNEFDLELDDNGDCGLCQGTARLRGDANANAVRAICHVGNAILEEIRSFRDAI